MVEPLNIIYYGPPGTGKTHQVQEKINELRADGNRTDDFYRFVTFHPSYAYEDFVEGIRPTVMDNGQVDYSVKDGVFKQLCDQARTEDPDQPYVMVIDEINRGNISSIFGELISLIEVSKRDRGEHEPGMTVTLPYSQQSFSVPANVHIYATMNTADRSLTLIDTALRRRFNFIGCYPRPEELTDPEVPTEQGTINVKSMLEIMNKRLELLYDRDHTIGHAYFMELIDLRRRYRFGRLADIMEKKIIPLLEEYFFDDLEKVGIVLGGNQKENEDKKEEKKKEKTRFMIKSNPAKDSKKLGNTNIRVSARYKLDSEALKSSAAYIGIYQAVDK